MSQILVFKPNFLVFNYTALELSEIREALYESYAMLIETELPPTQEELKDDELPIGTIYNQIISEIAFDDPDEWEWIVAEQVDVFEAVYNANGWRVTNDLAQIMLMDHVFFYDDGGTMHNYPTVKVW